LRRFVKKILQEKFGIPNSQLTKMEGYDSTNYKVESENSLFVLKKYDFSHENLELLKGENEVLQELEILKEYDFPFAHKSVDQNLLIHDQKHIYRVLSFVEGEFLGDVDHTPRLLRSFGKFLGDMDTVIHDKYIAPIYGKETQWDLQHFKKNHKFLEHIVDVKDRSLVDYFFLQFDEQVYPIQHQLRKGIIHNDGNDWNVLTKNGKVSGIIDFGDMCYSWMINELAVALTYVMMEKQHPLEVASEVIKGYSEVLPLQEIELHILYYLVAGRLCTSVCNSAYTKTLKPDSEYITVSEKPAWELLRKWVSINPIKAEDTFRMAAGFNPTEKKVLNEQLKKRRAHLSESLSLSYKKPIQMQRSAFQYMYDAEGNTFLDAYNNIMLAGHSHPKVVRAGQKSLAKLNTNTRYVYDVLQEYAEKLLSKFPESLNKIFFVNSGSAAGDLALRMAQHYSKKEKILTLEHGYHGNSKLTFDASHYKFASEKGTGQSDFVLPTPMPKVFGSGLADDGSAGKHYAKKAFQTIDKNKGNIAAFIAEPIVGCGGQVPLAKNYLNLVYPKIREQGGLCISDEVQVGFGRLGDFFWGFEMYDVTPDIVVVGKPMGNGHPIGAVITTIEIADEFEKGPEFFSSFGGNPVSCAIGNAVLDVIEEEGLQQQAKEVGDYLKEKLAALKNDFSNIADVRGYGMFLGIELLDEQDGPATELASKIKNHFRANHILISTDGPYDNVLKIKPPLSFTKNNADQLVAVLRKFFAQ